MKAGDVNVRAVISADQMQRDLIAQLDRMVRSLQEVSDDPLQTYMLTVQFDGATVVNVSATAPVIAAGLQDALAFVLPRIMQQSRVEIHLQAGFRRFDPLEQLR